MKKSSMNPKTNKEEEKIIHRNYGVIKPRSFFKLILTPISQSKKLRIPDNFARIYSNELSTTSILKVPTGETQEVTLLKEDNQLWFHNGWQEFMEYYSISYAFFLLFNYDGNSNFSVLIFNPTACEISYQRNPSNSISKEQCEICPEKMNGDNEEITSDTKEDTLFGRGYSMSRASKNYEALMKDVVAAGISRPKRPFFVTDIKSYALDTGLYLNVSLPFGRDHLGSKGDVTKLVILEAYDGRQWKVRCIISHYRCTFGSGWIIFAREIGLEVGDICVFERTRAEECLLKVHIAKKSQINAASISSA